MVSPVLPQRARDHEPLPCAARCSTSSRQRASGGPTTRRPAGDLRFVGIVTDRWTLRAVIGEPPPDEAITGSPPTTSTNHPRNLQRRDLMARRTPRNGLGPTQPANSRSVTVVGRVREADENDEPGSYRGKVHDDATARLGPFERGRHSLGRHRSHGAHVGHQLVSCHVSGDSIRIGSASGRADAGAGHQCRPSSPASPMRSRLSAAVTIRQATLEREPP